MKPPKTYMLRLTEADMVLLNRAIGELCLPFKDTAPLNDLVARVNEQIQMQSAPPASLRPINLDATPASLPVSSTPDLANGHADPAYQDGRPM